MKSSGLAIAEMGLKKGPWTAAEDAILIDYVRRHGEGNWNAVQKNSGLMRCGKSCRLRWANHLRPNLKKGSFTPEEERLIIELHAKLGNKWARMAAQLPGRTDNEIKNYWNTRIKRRQRAGLPIYPQEMEDGATTTYHHLPERQQGQQQFQQYSGRKRVGSSISGFPNLPSQRHKPDSNLSTLGGGGLNFSSPSAMNSSLPVQTIQSSFYPNPNSGCQFGFNNAGFMMPLSNSVNSQFGSSSNLNLYNPNFAISHLSAAPSTFQFNSGSGPGLSYSSLLMGAGPSDYVPELKEELPSIQTPQPQPTTPANSSSSGGGVCFKNGEFDPEMPRGSSGLLDDVLLEARVMSRKDGSEESEGKDDKGKNVVGAEEEEKGDVGEIGGGGDGSGGATAENQSDDQSSSQSSIGIKRSATEEHLEAEEMNSMDDDLLSLLNNFPTSMPLPDWYRGGGSSSISNGSSSDVAGRETVAGAGKNVSSGLELDWNLGSGYWNNMPGICSEGKTN